MNKFGTRLSLTSLDDRIVPSAALADPGTSGVVNAIHIDGTMDTGVTTGPYRPGDAASGGAVTEYVSVPTPGPTPPSPIAPKQLYGEDPLPYPNPPADSPKPIPAGPLPQRAGPQLPPRELSNQEVVKVVQLELANKALTERKEAWEDSRSRAITRRGELLRERKLDREALEANRLEIDMANEEIYMLERKINEIQNAIDTIKLAAQQGYPENSFIPPPEVTDRTKIGTADGKFMDICEVLAEMYFERYPLRPDLFS